MTETDSAIVFAVVSSFLAASFLWFYRDMRKMGRQIEARRQRGAVSDELGGVKVTAPDRSGMKETAHSQTREPEASLLCGEGETSGPNEESTLLSPAVKGGQRLVEEQIPVRAGLRGLDMEPQHLVALLAASERRNALRDYLLFVSGAIVNALFALFFTSVP